LGLPACSRASDVPLLLSGLRLVLRKVMGQLGTAQCARTYSFQSRILPTGYKDTDELTVFCVLCTRYTSPHSRQRIKRSGSEPGAGPSRVARRGPVGAPACAAILRRPCEYRIRETPRRTDREAIPIRIAQYNLCMHLSVRSRHGRGVGCRPLT